MPLQAPPPIALDGYFSDHCVVQRDKPIRVWGRAEGRKEVRVTFDRDTRTAKVEKGRFVAVFPKRKKALGLTIGLDGKTVARDVAVGEVWIASGQSNMEWPQKAADDYERAKREADPRVRMVTIPKRATIEPVLSVDAPWRVASAETVGDFSAVGNAFAHEIARNEDVVVGIVHASWGGTPAESWTSREALLARKPLVPMIERMDAEMKDYPAAKAKYDAALAEFERSRAALEAPAPDAVPKTPTRIVTLPTTLEAIEGKAVDGVFWVRRTIELSDAQAKGATTLRLGAIDDFDTVYVNGRKVAATGRETADWWSVPRAYALPAGTFRAGPNELAIRVVDNQQGGGFTAAASDLRLVTAGGDIPLSGAWDYSAETLLVGDPPAAPYGPGNPWLPTSLFNGMIRPFLDLNVRGVIWYQGESNAGRAQEYRTLMPALIDDWRERFRDKEMPFLMVSLANFMPRKTEPSESQWAELREAQDITVRTRTFVGQAVALDIGETDDIHPRNKREVGRRLALMPLEFVYGKQIDSFGPWARRVRPFGSTVIVDFIKGGALRTTDGAAPKGFAVKGKDGKWVWGVARIVRDTVEVTHPDGQVIEGLRYGWADNPDVNLVNGAGLPAVPFRAEGELGALRIG